MTPGSVVSRGDKLFVVLQAESARLAVALLTIGKHQKRRAGEITVLLCGIGYATVHCGQASVQSGVWGLTDYSISAAELAVCRTAADRAARERNLARFTPLSDFAQAQPHFRSGGRRVGGAPAST